jgi:hypothetical protein
VAGKWFLENEIPTDRGFILEHESVFTFDLYSRNFYPKISGSSFTELQPEECWIYVNPEMLHQLDLSNYEVADKQVLHKFHITALNAEFLNPDTRLEACKDRYILHLKRVQ